MPGTENTLRVRGKATIVRDLARRESMAIKGRAPDLALVVELTTAYFHCAKCIIRSELYRDRWADSGGRRHRSPHQFSDPAQCCAELAKPPD